MAQRLKITTPEGIAVWPRLNEPDREFDANGLYHTKLRVSGKEAEGFMHEVTKYRDDNYAMHCQQRGKKKLNQNDLPWKEDEENPGSYILSTKLKAKVVTRSGDSFEQRPDLVDAKLNPTNAKIGGGSKLKLAIEVNAYATPAGDTGVTLWVKAVQIIELVEYGGGASHGFTAAEGFESTGSDDDLLQVAEGGNF